MTVRPSYPSSAFKNPSELSSMVICITYMHDYPCKYAIMRCVVLVSFPVVLCVSARGQRIAHRVLFTVLDVVGFVVLM